MGDILLYSLDELFCYACQSRFDNEYKIHVTTSTRIVETQIEMNSYGMAIFDILYAGQCDNLIRYLHNIACQKSFVTPYQY